MSEFEARIKATLDTKDVEAKLDSITKKEHEVFKPGNFTNTEIVKIWYFSSIPTPKNIFSGIIYLRKN